MEWLGARTRWEIYERAEVSFIILFPVLVIVSLIMAFVRSTIIFILAALISGLYEIALLKWVKLEMTFPYAIVFHAVVFVAVSALFIAGFEFYLFGLVTCSCIGAFCFFFMWKFQFAEDAFRFFRRDTNGYAHNMV